MIWRAKSYKHPSLSTIIKRPTYLILEYEVLAVVTFAVCAQLADLHEHLLTGLVHAAAPESHLIQFFLGQLVGFFGFKQFLGVLGHYVVVKNLFENDDEKCACTEDKLGSEQ